MMGHREKLKTGIEWDAFHRSSRRMLRWGRGTVQKIKRTFWKRQRAADRAALGEEK